MLAIAAAVLYALLTPLSKLLMGAVEPITQAGLLYLGAGISMGVLFGTRKLRGTASARPGLARGDLRYVLAMVALDMAAPILLLLGLRLATPENVSLLNNFEIVATAVIAAALFRERVGAKAALSIGIIACACGLLSLDSGTEALRFSPGSLFVLLACVCWGFENNCTAALSEKDTVQIVMVKGLGSGLGSLVVSRIAGEGLPALLPALAVCVLGFLAVGLSVYVYVLAQSKLGAARTSAYYALAPFVGVLLSLVLFREVPGVLFWVALALMVLGVALNVQDTLQGEAPRS